jgi:hypothetical protein
MNTLDFANHRFVIAPFQTYLKGQKYMYNKDLSYDVIKESKILLKMSRSSQKLLSKSSDQKCR